jgi:hypothetical protein
MTADKARKQAARAHAAATGISYTAALRAVAAREHGPSGVVPGFEDLADPTAADVAAAGRLLLTRVHVACDQVIDDHCRRPDEVRAVLDQAAADIARLANEAEAGRLPPDAVDAVNRAADLLGRLQAVTHSATNFRIAAALGGTWALLRTANAARYAACTLSRTGSGPCDPDPGRVRLRIHDLYGHHDTDAGCIRHAGQEWARWDHGGEVTVQIIGPDDTARAVLTLGRRITEQ